MSLSHNTIKHQTCINPQLKIVPNKCTTNAPVWVAFAKNCNAQLLGRLFGLFKKYICNLKMYAFCIGTNGVWAESHRQGREVLRDGLTHCCFWFCHGICWHYNRFFFWAVSCRNYFLTDWNYFLMYWNFFLTYMNLLTTNYVAYIA